MISELSIQCLITNWYVPPSEGIFLLLSAFFCCLQFFVQVCCFVSLPSPFHINIYTIVVHAQLIFMESCCLDFSGLVSLTILGDKHRKFPVSLTLLIFPPYSCTMIGKTYIQELCGRTSLHNSAFLLVVVFSKSLAKRVYLWNPYPYPTLFRWPRT